MIENNHFNPPITAESRSLKNQAKVQSVGKRLDKLEKKMAMVIKDIERLSELFNLHGDPRR